jgi:putative ATPase
VLFVDELHRFNRAQQDVLLPDVEQGTVILVGATTHNPFHSINSPLLSRSQIFQFKALQREHIRTILLRAAEDEERGLGGYEVEIDEDALDFLAEACDGDARKALNALEVGVLSSTAAEGDSVHFDLALAEDSIQRKALVYDRDEDEHYDTASAFIKSMRGSDPDAALYWMAKMLEGGEDPRFIARRVVICAAEDVGNAAPNALVLASAAQRAVEFVGMPEARIPLAQAVTYIACAPKSNASYAAIAAAEEDVQEGRTLPVPDYLKDASYEGAEQLGHGEGYKYAHSFDGHWVDQDYIPTTRIYYQPTEQGHEKKLKERLERIREARGIAPEHEDESGPDEKA